MRAAALLVIALAVLGDGCRALETCEARLARLEAERGALDAKERRAVAAIDAKEEAVEKRYAERERAIRSGYARARADHVKAVAARYHALLADPRATDAGAAPVMNPRIAAAAADLRSAEARAGEVYGPREQGDLAAVAKKRDAWRGKLARTRDAVRDQYAAVRARLDRAIAGEQDYVRGYRTPADRRDAF